LASYEDSGYAGIIEEAEKTEGASIREDDEMDRSANALLLGLLVHGYLERHHFGYEFNKDLFDDLWERSSAYDHIMGDSNKDMFGGLREKACSQLERTVRDERLIKTLGGTSDYPETPFLINLSHGIDFRGTIDRIFMNREKGCWSIIDWKSNDLKGKNPKDVAEQNHYFLQLACYKYAVERITNERVEGVYIYFTDTGYLLESDFQFDAGDFFKGICEKIVDYSTKRQPPMAIECDDREMSKCRLCGYREVFCKRK
jgi:hypothetical protein